MKIIVLGMHRSGTSLACGLLNHCGIFFGEEKDLIQTNEENPKGFWERKDVRKLNDMLLHEMACDWSETSNLHKVTISKNVLEDFNSDACKIIKKLEQNAASGVIGLKEPRICLLMPYWQDLFDDNDFFLLVHRDPEEIAISLKNRNGIPATVSNYLTEQYLGHAIHAIKDRQYFIVSYKELIEQPVQSTQNIIDAINATGKGLTVPDHKKLVEHSTSALYRSRPTGHAQDISKSLKHLYASLNKNELPHVPTLEISIPAHVLSYQHSKRFEEFKKIKKLLGHLENRIKALESHAISKPGDVGQLERDPATIKNQLLSKNQSLLIAQSQQKVLTWKIQRQQLAIREANRKIVTTQASLRDSNHRLEEINRDIHSLFKISTDLINRLQLLFASRTWQISRQFISFMLRPLRFGSDSTVLDEIDHNIEEFNLWDSTIKIAKETGSVERSQETESLITSPPGLLEQESGQSPSRTKGSLQLNLSDNKNQPVKVGLVVTEDSDTTSAGDYFTARELATALNKEHGWECVYVPEHDKSTDWYDVSDMNILLVLLDKYDISRIHGSTKSLIKIAWVRNWVDRWTFRPWFQSYDLVLCTSEIARQFIHDQTGKAAHLLKIAANTERFHPSSEPNAALKSDYCFTGNYWGAPRQIEKLDPTQLPYEFALFGKGWGKHTQFANNCRGSLPYDKLPAAYANTKILIDDANHVTKQWASVNSRVFEALATGTLVITNGISGAQETFGDLLPTYSTKQDLEQQLRYFIDHPRTREKLANELRQIVLRDHSYTNRASQFIEILNREFYTRGRIAIKLPVQSISEAITNSDFQFGKGLAKALRKLGYSVRIDLMPGWYSEPPIPDDVIIAISGRSLYKPKNSHLNLLWVINDPVQVNVDEYNDYDNIFVASERYANQLKKQTNTKVQLLLQCADPELFSFKEGQHRSDNVVFVGNSDKKYCQILDDAISAGFKPMVVGKGWEGVIEESLIAGEYIENAALPEFYSSSGVVLCDHTQDTQKYGFISNQLFDAVLCGAVPVSRYVPGIKEVFGDFVYMYSNGPDELNQQIQKALSENTSMQQQRLQLSQKIITDHSFETRANVFGSTISHARSIQSIKR